METLIFSRDERHIEMKTLDTAMFTILLEKFPEDTEAQLLFLQNEFTYVRPMYVPFTLDLVCIIDLPLFGLFKLVKEYLSSFLCPSFVRMNCFGLFIVVLFSMQKLFL